MTPERPRRLGRGLEALISGAAQSAAQAAPGQLAEHNELQRIPLDAIRPNPFQPRHDFQKTELAELRASLQASGMLQPVVVRRTGSTYELISGERRFRAASQLGWDTIPALIRAADERTMLTLALIENLQRSDLNAMDEARGLHRLHEEFALTHQQIADAIGKDRSTVSNLLRFLSLPVDVQLLLQQNTITVGHAKALLALSDEKAIGRLTADIVTHQLNVRQTERRVRELINQGRSSPTQRVVGSPITTQTQSARSPFIRQIEGRLRRYLQTDVRIEADIHSKGTITIAFYSNDDLNRILEALLGKEQIGD